ncbi:MAG: hypothetical protein HQL20_04805 [Candidatus Omnitrophica bacterium]|nr:hypothetical protein [Candidatus Omnitrophota bacterium]
MKNVNYSKKELKGGRGRVVLVRESVPETDCDTSIRKSFVYLARTVDEIPAVTPAPEIRVVKAINSDAQREAFYMRVKGVVYFRQGRFMHKVDYLHTLAVQMLWKTHVLSSGPATLA